jgi:anti-sigma factor RsiW
MTTTFDRLGEPHAWCIELLPAFVGGTLQPNDSAAVLAHLNECAQCRGELTFAQRIEHQFARQWRGAEPLLDAKHEDAQFAQLWSRITADDPPLPVRRPQRYAAPLMALAASVLFGAGLFWYQNAVTPDYRTLADSPPRLCGQLRVQVDVKQTTSDTVRLLEGAGTQVVDGPTAEGVYTLRAANPTESLGRLRALGQVRLAEPTSC